MAVKMRPELSHKNRYRIDKHRHYELKHFCLQYPRWKKEYANLIEDSLVLSRIEKLGPSNSKGDPTADIAVKKAYYSERIKMVEKTADNADAALGRYILRAVTEGLSYACLDAVMSIPCSRDTYYDRYRRFFWLLSKERS